MKKKTFIVCFIIGLFLFGWFDGLVDDSSKYYCFSLFLFLLPFILYFVSCGIKKIIIARHKKHITKMERKVMEVSKNYQEVLNLNNKYKFIALDKNKFDIYEREYSLKSYDRVSGSDIIRYYVENNTSDLRSKIELAIKNKKLYDRYMKEFLNIDVPLEDDIINDKLEISKEKYLKIENKLLNKFKVDESVYNIKINVNVYYCSSRGQNRYSKSRTYDFVEIVKIYNDWLKGKNYEVSARLERSIMNDNIRYNVLKRDNFSCVLCGATTKDGVKLHVDHIIPVSKGGKTVMNNLRTLCDRCNKGKSNKIENNDSICPKCGGTLVKRQGKYGAFIGCSNYPKCHYVKEK